MDEMYALTGRKCDVVVTIDLMVRQLWFDRAKLRQRPRLSTLRLDCGSECCTGSRTSVLVPS